jgi:RNA polymerase sigma-32 factor
MGRGRKKKTARKPARSSGRKPAPPSRSETDQSEVLEPELVEDDEPLEPIADAGDAEAVDRSHEEAAKAEPIDTGAGAALVRLDSLGAYLAEIRRYPVLSREEEHELAVRYHETGDTEAAYRLITSNLRLVVMVAREYVRAFQNLLDLVQEGNIGLIQAVGKYDPYRGVKLSSYAAFWIRAYILKFILNNWRLVKIGTTQAQRRLFFNLQKEKSRLEALGFKPTPKLIAENLGVKEKEVIEMDQRMGASEASANAALPGSDTPMIDLLPADSTTAEDEVARTEFVSLMRSKLAEFAQSLEGREREIFDERLTAEDPVTLQELGERYGVSRERVRQIEEGIKKRLREFLVSQMRDLDAETIVA